MAPAASLEDVSAGYGATDVLHGVTLSIAPGEAWAVLGPNGAGKSTLARVVSGLLRPSRGVAKVAGHEVATTAPEALARHVAWVPQHIPEGLDFTALELALLGRAPFLGRLGLTTAADEVRAREALRRLDVEPLADRPLHRLSGGERRRVFLARALVHDAPLLVLDEPTAFLDVRHQVEALTLMRGLVSSTRAVVAVLHDVTLAAHFATHVALIDGGRLVERGPTADVLTEQRLTAVYRTPMRAVPPHGFLPSWPA